MIKIAVFIIMIIVNFWILYIQFNYTEYVTDHFKHVSKPVLVTAINDKCAQAQAKKEGRKYGKHAAQ